MKKRIFIVVGVAILIALLTAGGLFVYRVRGAYLLGRHIRKVADDLKVPKVVRGADRFSKDALFSEADLGVITDFEQNVNHELVVVGENGATFLKEDHTVDRRVRFERCDSDVVSVAWGSGAFLCRGTWNTNTTLFDMEGKPLWSYSGGLNGIDDAAAATLGPSGLKRIVVGFNGAGGVRLLSSEGKELWKQDDGNVWHVEIAPAADTPGNVILHSNARGQLTVRDMDGNVLGRYNPEVYLASFAMTAWGNDPNLNKLLASDENFVYILTANGKTLVRLPAPGSATMAQPKGTRVRFLGSNPYFAVLLRYSRVNRSIMYIYDEKNQLVYHEILDHDCDALIASAGKSGSEDLLLGCEGRVWKYSELANH